MLDILLFVARLLLVAVFVVAGLVKLANRKASRDSLVAFGLPTSMASPFGLALPVVELVIAVALVPTASSWWGALGALALLLLFIAGISVNLAKGRRPACNCFGSLDSAPISWRTLVRNAGLAAVAGLVLSGGWITAQLAGASGLDGLVTNVQVALFAVVGLALGAILLAEGWLIYRLHRRLVALESKLAAVGLSVSPTSALSATGLPVGARAPAFRLTGLEGEIVTLDNLRIAGKPIVLVFTDPGCGPCTQLLPAVGRWQREHAAQLAIVNVSRGPLEANRANSVKFGLKHVLVQQASEVNLAYQAQMAPSAVLVREDGTIGSTLALGEGAIRALVESVLGGVDNGQLPKPQPGAVAMSLATSDTH